MRFTLPLRRYSSAWILFTQEIKSEKCPHCSKSYTLKCHGSLYGTDIEKPDTIRRGLRFYCSNRYSNEGCGRTFSIHFSTVIPYHSVTAYHLGTFLDQLLKAQSVHQAWYQSTIPFSLRTAYQWMRKFRLNLSPLRANLYHLAGTWAEKGMHVVLETITMLQETFSQPCYLSGAQQKLQLSVLQPLSSSS